MNDTSFWVMIFVQTIGSVDMPGRGPRKMPAPRSYVAIVVTWFVLMLVAGIGPRAARAANVFGWVLVLTGLVAGPFGQTVVGFFQTIAQNFPAVSNPLANSAVPNTAPSTSDEIATNLGKP